MSERPDREDSRRDFLKKSVLAGGLVWAAPAVSTVTASGAQAAGTPVAACCRSSAFGLQVSLLGGTPQTFGVGGCVATVDLKAGGTALLPAVTVKASTVCGNSSSPAGGPCTASASLVNLEIGGTALATTFPGGIAASALSSTTAADCQACRTTGTSTLVGLRVGLTNVSAGVCNLNLLGLVAVNEQVCNADGILTVNALRVTVPGVINLIVAQSQAGAPGCACITC